jgi:hypothetical protein
VAIMVASLRHRGFRVEQFADLLGRAQNAFADEVAEAGDVF